jgi:hypothetical protein
MVNDANNCFTHVLAFSLGNNRANVWHNPRLIAASAAVYEELRLTERLHLQLRLDLQNPFKSYKWGGPKAALNVRSAANARLFGKTNPGIKPRDRYRHWRMRRHAVDESDGCAEMVDGCRTRPPAAYEIGPKETI